MEMQDMKQEQQLKIMIIILGGIVMAWAGYTIMEYMFLRIEQSVSIAIMQSALKILQMAMGHMPSEGI